MTMICEQSEQRLAFSRQGADFPLLVQNAAPGTRPFIHPWSMPDGQGVLTENQPPHHPWQHGLYVGLNGVNGVGFWTEGLRNSPTDGTFDPEPLAAPTLQDARACWEVKTTWRAPGGSALLRETQEWCLHDKGSSTQIDLTWSLEATVDLAFAQSSYGSLFLRMPWRAGSAATLLTSEGMTSPDTADQKRARWVAVSMRLPEGNLTASSTGGIASVAFFDHPGNAEHPAPWRVDGELGIAPSRCIAGEWHLARGAVAQSRYRLVSFPGGLNAGTIHALWKEYEGS